MTDHANEIRDVLMWAQAYAPDRLAHRLIDAEESLRELLAGQAAEVEQLRQAVQEDVNRMNEWRKTCDELERELVEARAETERLRNRLRDAPLGGDGSHWDGCHLVHIDCARAYIEDLAAETQKLREEWTAVLRQRDREIRERDAAVADRDYFQLRLGDFSQVAAEDHARMVEAVADRDRLAKVAKRQAKKARDLARAIDETLGDDDVVPVWVKHLEKMAAALAGREGSDDA